eukprot:COSAG06_NODE_559_length_14300_cov_98.800085_3_plen_713_part_00
MVRSWVGPLTLWLNANRFLCPPSPFWGEGDGLGEVERERERGEFFSGGFLFAMSRFVIAGPGMAVEAEGALVTKTTEASFADGWRCAAGPALGPAGVHWAEFVNESGGGMSCGLILDGWDVAGGSYAHLVDGHCFFDNHGVRYPGNHEDWPGRQPASAKGDRIGLRLDLGAGSLTVFKNGALLGVMQGSGLEGRAYRWAVSLFGKGQSMRLAAPSADAVAAMEAEAAPVVAAAAATAAGRADEPLPAGARVRVAPHGEGVYERFERCTFGANDHYIRFDSGGTKKVALRKLKPEDWTVLAVPGAAGLGAAVSGGAAGPPAQQQQQLLVAEPEPEPQHAAAPAAPSAEEGVPPPLTVDGWLASIKLAQYAAPLTGYGYDSLKVLLDATEADIVEMTEDPDVGMKKPHRRTMLAEWRQLKSASPSAPSQAQQQAAAASPSPPAAAAPPAAAVVPDKYIAADKQIRLGQPEDSTHGVEVLLGLTDAMMGEFYQDPIGAIKKEFALHGSADDKENLRCALDGIKKLGWASGISLDALLAHENATMAKLKHHHVLALRIYTTSSYSRINDPLRRDPPQRPHPFAATTFFIDKAIKMLRAVAASLPNAHTLQVYWRGMRDLGLTMEFLQKGGTEFACLSTSASQEVAVNFAASSLPLVFKFETKDFTSRGADIGWLSVYPNEKEALYPPLTYLRSIKAENETIGGVTVLVATVEPVFM